MTTQQQVRSLQAAHALLHIKAVGFSFNDPITFKSGIVSPVYVDNRRLPFFPESWEVVLQGLANLASEKKFDVIAGIETAGIPHSAALGYILKKPSVFIRKKIKDHGTKSRVEGGDVAGKRVLLLEDLVTTGGSCLAGVEALRETGATVTDCIAIVQYGFQESVKAFSDARASLSSLTDFPTILTVGKQEKVITADQATVVEAWLANPHGWRP